MNDLTNDPMHGSSHAADLVETSDESLLLQAPVVTVLMITYNHGPYLAEAIEGVVNQVCSFPFELIIGEDRSTDNTLEVALAYQKRYPHLIRVIHSSKNVGMNANSLRIFHRARGEYVAYCEGDDYWCDMQKLEKQVEIMQANPQIGIVHTDWVRAYLQDGKWVHDMSRSVHHRVAEKYLQGNLHATWHYPKILRTCTNLTRKKIMEEWYASGILKPNYLPSDSVMSSWITSKYEVGYVPSVAAVYRTSPNSALRSGARARVEFYRSCLEFDTDARQFFTGTPYQDGYRWDSTAGLLLWGLKAQDFQAAKQAIADFYRHFGVAGFIATGLKTIAMRIPTLRRQIRHIPGRQL